jgi:antitoxin MazE
MLLQVVPIGNSRGIRIPKVILDQCNIGDQIELEVESGRIIIEAVREAPRAGWDEAFRSMHEHGDDELLDPDEIDLDSEWEW